MATTLLEEAEEVKKALAPPQKKQPPAAKAPSADPLPADRLSADTLTGPAAVMRKSAKIKKLLQGKATLRHFMVMHEVLKSRHDA